MWRVLLGRGPLVPVTLGALAGRRICHVIAESATTSGTMRSFGSDDRSRAIRCLTDAVERTSRASGTRITLELGRQCPPLICDPAVTRVVRGALAGAEHLTLVDAGPISGSDDMACYLQRVPGCYLGVGGRIASRQTCASPPPGVRYR